ncbi:unnamed protein product [Amaranthus hypochondriacus]
MGRRGRPLKVKAVPRRASGSDLDRESSSYPDRYLFQSTRAPEDVAAHSLNLVLSPAPNSLGLNWVSVLKGSSSKPGNPPISVANTPIVIPIVSTSTVPLLNPTCSPAV